MIRVNSSDGKVLVIMLMAWGYLLWGQWQFEASFHGDAMFGHIVFASLATMVCFFVLILLARMDVTSREVAESVDI